MPIRVDGFDWNEGNRSKCEKHGVSVATIEALFGGELAVLPDPEHSKSEERFKAIGTTGRGRPVFLIFTFRRSRNRMLIRPISARYMHRKEIEHYEKEIATTPKR